jgi:hypothetical protein
MECNKFEGRKNRGKEGTKTKEIRKLKNRKTLTDLQVI